MRLVHAGFFIVAFLLTSGSCGDKDKYDKNLNPFMDDLFKRVVADYGNQLDPIELPAANISIYKETFLMTFSGTIKLTKGQLSGLRSLRRIMDYNITNQVGNLRTFSGESGAATLLAKYDTSINMVLFNIHPTLNVDIDMIRLKSDVVVDFQAKSITLTKTKLFMDGFKVTFSGLGLLNSIADYVISYCEEMLKPQFEKTILQAFAQALGKVLKKIVFPF